MYQITPYDLTASFKLIPYGEKYQITFWSGNSVMFRSKRKAYSFISSISKLFSEVSNLCELINNNLQSYSFQIVPKSKSKNDLFHKYHSNARSITESLTKLKCYRNEKCEMYQIVKLFDTLLLNLYENAVILNERNNNCCSGTLILLNSLHLNFQQILINPLHYFENKKLTVFKY